MTSLSGGNLSSAWLLARCKNRRIAVNLLRGMVDEYRGLRRTSDVDQCMLYRGLLLMPMDRSNATNAIMKSVVGEVQKSKDCRKSIARHGRRIQGTSQDVGRGPMHAVSRSFVDAHG